MEAETEEGEKTLIATSELKQLKSYLKREFSLRKEKEAQIEKMKTDLEAKCLRLSAMEEMVNKSLSEKENSDNLLRQEQEKSKTLSDQLNSAKKQQEDPKTTAGESKGQGAESEIGEEKKSLMSRIAELEANCCSSQKEAEELRKKLGEKEGELLLLKKSAQATENQEKKEDFRSMYEAKKAEIEEVRGQFEEERKRLQKSAEDAVMACEKKHSGDICSMKTQIEKMAKENEKLIAESKIEDEEMSKLKVSLEIKADNSRATSEEGVQAVEELDEHQSKAVVEALKEEVSRLNEQISSLSSANAKLSASNQSLNEAVGKTQSEVAKSNAEKANQISDLTSQNKQLSESASTLKAEVSAEQSQRKLAEEKFQRLSFEMEQMKAQISDEKKARETAVAPLQSELDQAKASLKEATDSRDKAVEELNDHKAKSRQLKALLKNLQKENKRLKDESTASETEHSDFKLQFEKVTQQLLDQTNQNQQLTSELQKKDEKFESLSTELRDSEERVRALEEQQMLNEANLHQMETKLSKSNKESQDLKAAIGEKERSLNELQMKAKQMEEKRKTDAETIEHLQQMSKETENSLADAESKLHLHDIELVESATHLEEARKSMSKAMAERDESVRKLKEWEQRRSLIRVEVSEAAGSDYVLDEEKAPDNSLQSTYIQKVLMEFFTKDDKSSDSMVPIILRFVGCQDFQVDQATKAWRNRGKFRFGFF